MSLSHCGPQGLLSSDGLQGATGDDASLSLSSHYPSSCPLSPSSHPRAFLPSNNGRHRALTLTVAQWRLRLLPGLCLSRAFTELQNLLIYPPKALPNLSLPAPTTPHLEEGSGPSQGLPEMPTPLGQHCGIRLFPNKHISQRMQWDLSQA